MMISSNPSPLISPAGDINNDGFDDLIIGANNADPNGSNSGETYVVFGNTRFNASLDLSTLDGTNGFILNGIDVDDLSGISVSSAGDINGDGFDDLIIGANTADSSSNGISNAGESYVVFGKGTAFNASINLSTLDGTTGFVLNGVDINDGSGISVSSAGDVNGDGFDDLIIGANGADGAAGETYIVFGKASGFTDSFDLSTIDSSDGFVLNGIDAGDGSGISVSRAGDVNGDGFDDLIIGANAADPNGSSSGETYIVFGNDFSGSTTHIGAGTSNADTLTGTSEVDVMIGGLANDILDTQGGADIVYGGMGDDEIRLFDTTFFKVDGGGGTDTFVWNSATTLNFTTIGDSKVESIEIIDLSSNTGDLVLDAREVLNLTKVNNDVVDGAHKLIVQGDADNTLTLKGIGWTETGAGSNIYTNGTAEVHVDSNVVVNIVPVQLSDLNGIDGFVLFGIDADDFVGQQISSAGDINGDGFDDIIIGAKSADPNGSGSGETYVVFGKASGFNASFELSTLALGDGTDGFVLNGIGASDFSGSVSSAGDVNGDGFDDILIGAQGGDPNGSASGETYVVFGKAAGFGASFELSTLASGGGTDGFVLNGIAANHLTGDVISSADINGDGFNDLIIGSSFAAPNGNFSGEVYVVFGKGTAFSDPFELSSLASGNGSTGFVINGIAASNRVGTSVSNAGDINGDGFDDIIIGSSATSPGTTYVVYGKGTAFAASLELSTFAAGGGADGFTITGIDASDNATRVSSAGDINGDGIDDLIIGATEGDPNGSNSGESYIVFGNAAGFGASLDLSTIASGDGTDGFVINGINANDRAGRVSSAGDFNGDGFDDLLIGAAGASYIVFGKAAGFGASLELSTIASSDGTEGITFTSIDQGDTLGRSVSSAGDINGDGFDDILLGALFADGSDNATIDAGETYLIFGGDYSSLTTHLGTENADILTGTNGADIMIGGLGDDVLDTKGGADTAYGGVGDDEIRIADVNFLKIDGGGGTDTLVWDNTGKLDLTSLANNKIDSIEVIDLLSNIGELELDLSDVLALTNVNNVEGVGAHKLTVHGDADNTVTFTGGGWAATGVDTYFKGTAEVKLDADIVVVGVIIP